MSSIVIPGDKGHPHRLNKFVEYQRKVPAIHPITLMAYAKKQRLKKDDLVILAWLISATYCEVTALFLFERLDWSKATDVQIDKFWKQHKAKLIFNSARRYAKNLDWFPVIAKSFRSLLAQGPYNWLAGIATEPDGLVNYCRVYREVKAQPFTGRFAADLVLELLWWGSREKYWKIPLEEPVNLDWKNCSNLTSGLLNVLYRDEEADAYDRTGAVSPEMISTLNTEILNVQRAVQKAYPGVDARLPMIQTKLCSFRNLFKGTRYGGYHHDRQLANILTYQHNYPNYPLWQQLFRLRASLFDRGLLGEFGGWSGVRKERNKLWLDKGLTGVETI